MNDDLYTLDEQYFSRKIFIIWTRNFFFYFKQNCQISKGKNVFPKK